MNLEWIISLVAVAVSMVTIIISYLTNKENLKHASFTMTAERRLDFNVSVWNDIIDLSEKLLLATNQDHFERLMNIIVAGKSNDTKDEDILNEINGDCEAIRSIVFNLCAKIKVIDRENKVLRDKIRVYSGDVIDIFKRFQEFYLNKRASKSEYDKIVAEAVAFGKRSEKFSHGMQDYISELQNRLFEINK